MKELNGFSIKDFNIYDIAKGAKTSTCPECSEDRKKTKDKCMSVFWDTGLGQCNHCGARVQLHTYEKKEEIKVYVKPIFKKIKSSYSDVFLNYAKEIRHISESTLNNLKITEGKDWMPKAKENISTIHFNYFLNDELINIKYRGKNKDFKLHKDSEKIFYNLDSIATDKECVIVEGEWDVCAFVESKIYNVISVPNGFTVKGDIKLDYLDNYYNYFENKERIYLALDADEAGRKGQAEFITRLGADKCYLIDFKDCKDANEYLIKYGADELNKLKKEAKQVPLEHVETLKDFEADLDDFYLNGSPKGYTEGTDLDDIYSFEMSQYTIFTGPPQSGKSEKLDGMCVNYANRYGFKTAFASPENKPNKFHSDKLLRKVAGYRPSTIEHLKSKRITKAKDFVNEHFHHVEYNQGFDLETVLSKFAELRKRKGVKIFVIDPFNKVNLKGADRSKVNIYTGDYLNKIDIFVKANDCHLFLVMHPNKMQKEEKLKTYKMPTAYDIKGGGEVFDMAYHILATVKDVENGVVRMDTLKVKFQHLGSPDKSVFFGWNINNGRYDKANYCPDKSFPTTYDWTNDSILDNKELTEAELVSNELDGIDFFDGGIFDDGSPF